jgi:hypothetical protein
VDACGDLSRGQRAHAGFVNAPARVKGVMRAVPTPVKDKRIVVILQVRKP